MMNQTMFKKISTLGLIGVASFASDATLLAAPRRTATAAAANQTTQIPQRNAGYGGVSADGDKGVGIVTGDSVPYHLRGSVVYEVPPAPSTLGLALKEIHVVGWLDANGHLPYACGTFSINAKHVTINGRDVSGNLVLEPALTPRGSVVSGWVARFLGPTYPRVSRGTTIAIRADVAYSDPCVPVGNHSLTTSVVIR